MEPDETQVQEIDLKHLDPRLRNQVDKAKVSIQRGNSGYAVEICLNILKTNPGCLDVRKILRKAQIEKTKAKSGKGGLLSGITAAPFSMMSSSLLKKDPLKAIDQAEKMLCENPKNVLAHKLLGQAAERLKLYNTAAYALDIARQLEPDDYPNLKDLGNVYMKLRRYDEAIKIGNHVFQKNQGDVEAQDLVKQASVAQSMEKGNWEEKGDFRDKLKDQDEAIALEQQARNINDDEALADLIERAKIRVDQNPKDLSNYKEIASSYRKLGDMASAVEWIGYARQLESGAADVTLEETEAQYYLEWMAQEILNMEAELENDPENEELQQYLEAARQEEMEYRYHEAVRMVEKYPNDYGYQFTLGKLLFEMGYVDDAIQPLQLGQRSPKDRVECLYYLGKSYKEKQFFDLAAEQLEIAKKEVSQMNDQKKEIIYELAACYESNGEPSKAISEYKQLYTADMGFRDVAQKIDDFYNKR
jgi:tetratricopeptide (TPR) repeat protein